MKKLYLLLSEITMIIFLFSGCECGPGSITEPIERPEPEIPPSPPPPPPQPPTTQNEYFQIEGNNLVYFDGVNKYYLIKNKVENIRFEKVKGEGNAYYVTVNLRLKDGEIKTTLDSLISLRNINRTITSSRNSGSSSSGNSSGSGGSSGTTPPPQFEPIEPPRVGPVEPIY